MYAPTIRNRRILTRELFSVANLVEFRVDKLLSIKYSNLSRLKQKYYSSTQFDIAVYVLSLYAALKII